MLKATLLPTVLVSSSPVVGALTDQAPANIHADRSGDVFVAVEPRWFVADFDGLHVASAHGSPGRYDTHLPLIFAGPGVPAGRIARRVETVDVAPALAVYLGTRLPTGALGRPLVEVFR